MFMNSSMYKRKFFFRYFYINDFLKIHERFYTFALTSHTLRFWAQWLYLEITRNSYNRHASKVHRIHMLCYYSHRSLLWILACPKVHPSPKYSKILLRNLCIFSKMYKDCLRIHNKIVLFFGL